MEPQVAETIARSRARVEEDVDSAEAWGELGMVFQAHELFSEAHVSYAEAGKLAPQDYRWPYLEARSLKEIRELDAAEAAVLAAIERNGGYAPLFVLEAELEELEGDFEEAEASYRRALDVDSRSAPAAYGIGRLRLADGDLATSLEYLEKAAALEPDAGAIRATLSRVYRRLGERDRALDAAALAKELHPEVPLDDPVMAAVAERAVSVVGLQSRAVEADRRGEPQRAEALLRRMIALRPDEANLYYNLANNLSRQGRLEEATAQYQEALRLQPDHVAALINLGNVFSQNGELAEAARLFQKALAISPNHPGALSSLGKLAVTRGDMKAAISYLEKAIARDPRRADSHYVLAQILRSEGRRREAVDAFRRALELAPERADIHFDLAVTYAQLGQFTDSWQSVHRAERLGWKPSPDFLKALSRRQPDPNF